MSTTKAIKGERKRERERERVRHNKREREREIEIEPSALDWNSKARTKHNITTFPNSQNPTAEIHTERLPST